MTFGYVLLSWIAPDSYSPAGRVLADLIGPLLRRLRRYLPTVAGLDLSPMVLVLCLYVLQMILMDRIRPLLFSLG
jgi:YggT family protein